MPLYHQDLIDTLVQKCVQGVLHVLKNAQDQIIIPVIAETSGLDVLAEMRIRIYDKENFVHLALENIVRDAPSNELPVERIAVVDAGASLNVETICMHAITSVYLEGLRSGKKLSSLSVKAAQIFAAGTILPFGQVRNDKQAKRDQLMRSIHENLITLASMRNENNAIELGLGTIELERFNVAEIRFKPCPFDMGSPTFSLTKLRWSEEQKKMLPSNEWTEHTVTAAGMQAAVEEAIALYSVYNDLGVIKKIFTDLMAAGKLSDKTTYEALPDFSWRLVVRK